jgi:hypothetical protein
VAGPTGSTTRMICTTGARSAGSSSSRPTEQLLRPARGLLDLPRWGVRRRRTCGRSSTRGTALRYPSCSPRRSGGSQGGSAASARRSSVCGSESTRRCRFRPIPSGDVRGCRRGSPSPKTLLRADHPRFTVVDSRRVIDARGTNPGDRSRAASRPARRVVREVVDRELQALVEAELAARIGNGSTAQAAGPLQETRHCRGCDRDLPASAFERGRHICRACRRQQERDRERQRKATADDVP